MVKRLVCLHRARSGGPDGFVSERLAQTAERNRHVAATRSVCSQYNLHVNVCDCLLVHNGDQSENWLGVKESRCCCSCENRGCGGHWHLIFLYRLLLREHNRGQFCEVSCFDR